MQVGACNTHINNWFHVFPYLRVITIFKQLGKPCLHMYEHDHF